MIKSIVTGGAGFIGSHIVDKLVTLGHEVIVIDNESADCNENYYYNKKAKNYKLDICDYILTRKLYDNVDYVFHLAAESRLQPAIENPINAYYKNVIGTSTVLQCSREAKVKRVVYSSTSSIYGNNLPPNEETDKDDCLNPYSLSKMFGEKICKQYSNLYGVETIILRYFNVYGDRSPTKGQYAPVIGIFLKQKEQNIPLTIVGDGSQRRDFINVLDVAEANIAAALTKVKKKHLGQVFNIGSGRNISVIDIANAISTHQLNIPKRPAEALTTLSIIKKAKKVFNWKPTIKLKDWLSERK